MNKIVLFGVVALIALSGCSKKDDPAPAEVPVAPKLSLNAVSVEEEQRVEILVTGGKSPYTVSVSPTGVATLSFNGATLVITGVKAGTAVATVKGNDGGTASPLNITVTAKPVDPYAAFKADPVPRWEVVGSDAVRSDMTAFTFFSDDGTLFSSGQRKWGYAAHDGSVFRFIEWGVSPVIRTESGTVPATSFQIRKTEGTKEWLSFTDPAGNEHRVVTE